MTASSDRRGPRRNRRPTLPPHEVAARDKRARDWMNQRKIERVAEAAARHGWYEATVDELHASAAVRSLEPYEVLWPGFGLLSIVEIDFDRVSMRLREAWVEPENE